MEEKNTTAENKESSSAPKKEEASSNFTSKKAIGTLMVFGLVAFGVWMYLNQSGSETTEIDFGEAGMEQSSEDVDFTPTKEYPAVIAVVNGQEITNEDFATAYVQVAQSAWQQGADITDIVVVSEIETRVLDVLTSTALLTQAAEAAGNSVSDAEVDAELALIESQFASPEEFAETIDASGLTIDNVKSEIRDRLLIDAYLGSAEGLEDVTVTEAEIQEIYDTYFAGTEDAPALEEVSAYIEEQLVAEKQQEIVEGLISGLEENGSVETMI